MGYVLRSKEVIARDGERFSILLVVCLRRSLHCTAWPRREVMPKGKATPLALTAAERTELEGLVRRRKTA